MSDLKLYTGPCGGWEPPRPGPDGVIRYVPPPHCSVDMRKLDDLRETIDIRKCACPQDWYDPELHPWIISQYSGAHQPAFDFRTSRDIRTCRDIRHPEYNNIIQLILGFGRRLRPADDLALLYREWLDLDTARGVGLDHNGEIVGIDRKVRVYHDEYTSFGFNGSGRIGFQQGTFSPHPVKGFFTQDLLDYQYRRLIWFKSVANRSNASSADINSLFRIGLGFKVRKRVAVADLNAMHMRIMVMYQASPLDLAILRKMAAIVKPVGVYYDMYVVPEPKETLGFNGSSYQPFGQGTFNRNKLEDLSWKPDIPADDNIFFGMHKSRRNGFNTYWTVGRNESGTFNSEARRGKAQGPYPKGDKPS